MNEALKNATILVVDDDVNTCNLLRVALESAGATVIQAQTVAAAIEAFRRRPAHGLIADIRIGESDGYDLIKAIRELNVEYRGYTAAVAVTGYASPEDEAKALAAGFNAYVAKPFAPAEVIAVIAACLGGPADNAA